jgi:fructokinase
VAGYIGQLAAAIALLHAPQSLVIGGGVMSDGTLLPLVRQSTAAQLGGYLEYLRDPASMGAFIRAPGLGNDSAIAGAMLMALEALSQARAR